MSSTCLRQALLDHLKAHPASTPREVWLALGQGVQVETVSRCLTELVRQEACTRTQDLKERGAPFRYTATTAQAKASSPRGAPKQGKTDEPGRYVHNKRNRRPIKNPDCQGALLGFFCMSGMLDE